MTTWSLPSARPIACNDCPAFQRLHISARCVAESFHRLACVMNTTFRKKDLYQVVLHRPVEPAVQNRISVMPSEWCCARFRERFFQTDGRRDGLGILWFVRSRATPVFVLEYRRPNRELPERIAEDGIKIEFCPWCGRNLLEHYGAGLPPFHSASSE